MCQLNAEDMMRTFTLAIVAGVAMVVVLAAAQTPTQVPSAPPTAAQIQALLAPRIGDHPGLGIVVGFIDSSGKRTVVTAGTAGEGISRPLDGHTVFEIGSASKAFTATLLAEMVGRGEVSLADPVAKLLPSSVRMPARDGREITLETLATHTSGLPRLPSNLAPANPENPYADYTVEQLYQFLGGYQLTRPIGDAYEYSNLGMGLLGHALALKLGKTYETAVTERVLTPLGMKDTRIALTPDMKARLARGYAATGYASSYWDLPTLAGAGAIRSTVDDLLTFVAANLGSAGKPPLPFLAATHAARHEAGKAGQIGLAWHIRSGADVEIVWHNGGTGGFHSFVGFDEKRRIGVVILHNSAVSIDDLGFHLLNAQFPLTPAKPPARPRVEVAVDEAALEALVGQYELLPTFVLTITREGTRLFLQATGQPRFPVFAESETRFFLKVVDAQLTFVKDASGKATEVVLHQNGVDQKARRK
jgi:serine-type D-Ala-D-Ala carboxypeptidase/endopeptidase